MLARYDFNKNREESLPSRLHTAYQVQCKFAKNRRTAGPIALAEPTSSFVSVHFHEYIENISMDEQHICMTVDHFVLTVPLAKCIFVERLERTDGSD